jgi:hypothetical protein
MHSDPSFGTEREPATNPPGAFDAWFLARPEELALMRHTLQEWLAQDCALDDDVAREVLIAAHEAGAELLGQLKPVVGGHEGFAVRAEYDGTAVTVTLVAPDDVCVPPLQDPSRWTTQLVLRLVDEAEVEARDDAAQVSLRRDAHRLCDGE